MKAPARMKAMSNAPWNLVNTIGNEEWLNLNRENLLKQTPNVNWPSGYGFHLRMLGVAWQSERELRRIITFLGAVLFKNQVPQSAIRNPQSAIGHAYHHQPWTPL